MRRFVLNTLGLGMILVLAGACTSGSESTIDAPPGLNGSDDVSGGEIIVSGDLAAGTAAPDPGDADTIAPATTVAPQATVEPSTSAAPTRSPAETTPSESATVTTEAEPVGDGPVLTSPVGNDDSGESPGIGNGLRPAFFALEATTVVECADANPGTVNLRWEVIGAESVDVSVGAIGDIRSPDEPPAGTIELPLDCTAGSQYFVIAENPDGETIRSVTVGAG
jgi:hypothetical protein